MPSTLDEYEVLGTIGTGSYGTCKKIKRKKDKKVLVWKELDYGTMTESEKQMLVSEVNLLRELKHAYIVRYYDRIIDRSRSMLYIVMEFCEGGDLATFIAKTKKEGGHVDEEFVWKICLQVTSALQECHSRTRNGKTVLHRDVKPANVFLDSYNNVKLGDFGLARVLTHDTSFAKTFVGTPYYMSPEQMNYMSYNEKSDIWSLGCLLYELCALKPPFTASNQRELASRICVGRFCRIPLRYSDDLNEIISFMLQVEESKRPTIEQLGQHSLICKRMYILERRSSTSSDDGYRSAIESLKKREDGLKEKEKELKQKEKDLEAREKNLIFREKLAEERMSRAEKMMKECAMTKEMMSDRCTNTSPTGISQAVHSSALSDLHIKPKSSCLTKSRQSLDNPKKKVSFWTDKENKTSSYSNLKVSTTDDLPMYNKKITSNVHVDLKRYMPGVPTDRFIVIGSKAETFGEAKYQPRFRSHLLAGLR